VLEGLTVAICGDVLHSRVARSNIHLLLAMNSRVRIVAPPTLIPAEAARLGVEVHHDMRTGLKDADVVMMLRLQKERMTGGLVPSAREFFRFYGLDAEKLAVARPGRHRHASRPDEPRRRDRQRGGRRPGAQRHRRTGGDGRRGAHGRARRAGARAASQHMTTLHIVNARLLDPATGLDAPGELLARDGLILDHGAALGRPDGAVVVDADGACLAPGLVDLRAAIGEPGAEHRETIASAALAAAAGGITTLCALPDTDPRSTTRAGAVRDPPRRDDGQRHHPALCRRHRRLRGKELSEFGLLREAGAIASPMAATRSAMPAPCASHCPTPAPSPPSSCSTRRSPRSPPAAPRPRASAPPAWACPASRRPPRRCWSSATSRWPA
jgi:hypothetical protein